MSGITRPMLNISSNAPMVMHNNRTIAEILDLAVNRISDFRAAVSIGPPAP